LKRHVRTSEERKRKRKKRREKRNEKKNEKRKENKKERRCEKQGFNYWRPALAGVPRSGNHFASRVIF
jgi:hypothetical protein